MARTVLRAERVATRTYPAMTRNNIFIGLLLGLLALILLAAGCDDGEPYEEGPLSNDPAPKGRKADGIPDAEDIGKDKTPDIEEGEPEETEPQKDAEAKLAQIDFDAAPVLGATARRYYRALLARDWGAVWEMLSEKSQQFYENREEWDTVVFSLDELDAIRGGKDYYIQLMRRTIPKTEILDPITGEKISADGKSGYLYNDNGKTFEFVLEAAGWKLAIHRERDDQSSSP